MSEYRVVRETVGSEVQVNEMRSIRLYGNDDLRGHPSKLLDERRGGQENHPPAIVGPYPFELRQITDDTAWEVGRPVHARFPLANTAWLVADDGWISAGKQVAAICSLGTSIE